MQKRVLGKNAMGSILFNKVSCARSISPKTKDAMPLRGSTYKRGGRACFGPFVSLLSEDWNMSAVSKLAGLSDRVKRQAALKMLIKPR
jgi:hypothetical protein